MMIGQQGVPQKKAEPAQVELQGDEARNEARKRNEQHWK